MNQSNIPRNLKLTAIQHILDETKTNFGKNRKISDLLDEIRERCIREIYDLLGSKAQEYVLFREKSRDIAKTKRHLFTATPEGRKIKAHFQKTRIDEANEFIKKLGINHKDIKSILKKYQEDSKSVIEKKRPAIEILLDVGSIPPDVADPDRHWTLIEPPYYYAYGDRFVDTSGSAIFRSDTIHSESNLTGEISCLTKNQIIYPGDHATELDSATSNLLIYFQMPYSGRLNAWSFLECVESSYSGELSDEWGWSDANIIQSSAYFMAVGGPPDYDSRLFPLLYYHRGEDDGEWSGTMALPGEYRYPNFISNTYYSAGEWVFMRTGITDFQDVVVNDMEFIGEIRNSWILRKLAISVIS